METYIYTYIILLIYAKICLSKASQISQPKFTACDTVYLFKLKLHY